MPKSLSIGMFSNLYHPVVSGSSTQSESLARELLARGHRPFMITSRVDSDSPEFEERHGVPVYRLPCFRLPPMKIALNFGWLNAMNIPGNRRRVGAILRKHAPDVLHQHNHMFDSAFLSTWARTRFHLPLVTHIHTMIRHSNPLFNLLLTPGDRLFLRYGVIQRSDMLICPDFNIKSYVEAVFPKTPNILCPYGVNLLPAPDQKEVQELRDQLGFNNKPVIVSLGHIHDIRCRRDLISALPKVREAFPDVKVVIVGGEFSDIPRKLAKKLNVEDAVVFYGPANYSQISAFLSLADLEMHLFYQDKQENQSLGIATEEAMGAGVAVINAANPNTFGPSVLRDGENICFVRRGDYEHVAQTICDLLSDKNKAARIGKAAARTIREHLTWDPVCEKMLDAYHHVAKLFLER